MIKNYKEYEITKKQSELLKNAIVNFDFIKKLKDLNSSVRLIHAEYLGLVSEYSSLVSQLEDYEDKNEIVSVELIRWTIANDLFTLKWKNISGETGDIDCYKDREGTIHFISSGVKEKEFIKRVFSKLIDNSVIDI